MMTPDRPLPQATEIEEIVIGTILAYPDSLNNVMTTLTAEMFYKSDLRIIYKTCLDLIQQGRTPELNIVTSELHKRKIECDPVYLTGLCQRVVTDKMIESHAAVIREQYMKRLYIQHGQELVNMAYTEDLESISEKAETDILNISGLLDTSEPVKLGVIVDESVKTIDKIIKKEISLVGVPSGFTQFDRQTGGFKKGELIIIAARPGIGKTALALQIAKNASELNYPVGIFSSEMSKTDISYRYLSGVSGYSNSELKSGRCDIDKVVDTSEALLNLPIYIDDTSAITLLEIRAKSRKMILRYGIKMIIVDYLQLMKSTGQTKLEEVSKLSAGLKSIAKDMNLPVIVLSQLNRRAEDRQDRRPHLPDLRDSGTIEQDADIVMMLWRPDYYGIKTAEICGSDRETKNLIVIDIAKNRNGPTGEMVLFHNEYLTVIHENTI